MAQSYKLSSFMKFLFRFIGSTIGLAPDEDVKEGSLFTSDSRQTPDSTIINRAILFEDIAIERTGDDVPIWMTRPVIDTLNGRELRRHISKQLREKNKIDKIIQRVDRKTSQYSQSLKESGGVASACKVREEYVNAISEGEVIRERLVDTKAKYFKVAKLKKMVEDNDTINLEYIKLYNENKELKNKLAKQKTALIELKRKLRD